MMKRKFIKIISGVLVATMLMSTTTVAMAADSASGILPSAGNARALGEGKSVTTVKAEKIISERAGNGKSISDNAKSSAATSDAVIDSVLSQAGASISISAKTSTSVNEHTEQSTEASSEGMTVGLVSTASASGDAANSVTKTASSEPEILTVGGGSTGSSVDVAAMTPVADAESASDNNAAMEEISEEDLVSVITRSHDEEEEDFTNLVIAQVDDCVNVRAEASEDSEVIGKLYNNSVGNLIEEAGDWYRIDSGSCNGYVKAEYCVTGDAAQELASSIGTRLARVTTTTLYVRSEPTRDSEVIGMVPMDDELQVLTEMPGWVKVSIEEGDGFVSDEYVKLHTEFVRAESKAEEEARLKREEEAREAARRAAEKAQGKKKSGGGASGGSSGGSYAVSGGSGQGSAVANYALQFVGNPYVYGGSSLTNGTDCSGFVMSVYRNFGISLPHSSGADRGVGYGVPGGLAAAQPGDIVCYSGHVGIYIGGGQIVHASTAATGIKVSNAGYRSVLAVRRIF